MSRVSSGLRRVFSVKRWTLETLNYDDYWDHREHDVFQPRFAAIAHLIPRGASVADVGCGDGSLLRFLKMANDNDGWGVDISTSGVNAARQLGADCEVGDITDERFRLPQTFDYVVISEVLEHIPDPERVLARLHASGPGRLLVTVPNTGYLEHRLRLLFGRFPVQWLMHPGEHLRFWTVADFRSTAEMIGYEVRSVTPALGWFPFARVWPELFASQVIYELAWKTS